MILVDTNVLIALCDARDELHETTLRDLVALDHQEKFVCEAVLGETVFGLRPILLRRKLIEVMRETEMKPWVEREPAKIWAEAFEWLIRYADHRPDWADGYIVAVSARNRKLKVWTYDEEFRTIWRRPDGTAVPLAVK